MLAIVLNMAFALVAVAIALGFWRLLAGPSAPDRILALDTLAINAIALLILLGIRLGSGLYFEAALLIALIG
jgi:multicomponent K+:H+ antiporter subunit F